MGESPINDCQELFNNKKTNMYSHLENGMHIRLN